MSIESEFAERAMAWIDTPYRHQGRINGLGCDCAGLVIGVAHEMGLSDFDTLDYGRIPDGASIAAHCAAHLRRVPIDDLAVGHIVVMRWKSQIPNHLAICVSHPLAGLALVHALATNRKVAMARLDEATRALIASAWRFPTREEKCLS